MDSFFKLLKTFIMLNRKIMVHPVTGEKINAANMSRSELIELGYITEPKKEKKEVEKKSTKKQKDSKKDNE